MSTILPEPSKPFIELQSCLVTEPGVHRFNLIDDKVCVCVCVSDSGQIEKQLEDVTSARRDMDDSSKHTRNLEKQIRSLTQEKDDLHKVPPHQISIIYHYGVTGTTRTRAEVVLACTRELRWTSKCDY